MFKTSAHTFLHISLMALLVLALAFGASGAQVARAQEGLSEGCAQLAFVGQFLGEMHGLGFAPFHFFAGETVRVTVGGPSTGDPQTVSIINHVVVATALFPGTASYIIPSDGIIDNLVFTLDQGSATMVIECTAAGFNFSGFFQPVDNLPTLNKVKAGAAVPVKFSLGGDQGLAVFAAGYPLSTRIDCDSSSSQDAIEQTVTAGGSSLSYDPTTDTYTYVWKTDKSWAGTCRQLTVKLSDGSEHIANFRFSR
ncbi:MAG TPA: PxKF domain-containing protein [Anaerolineales bacterium]|nr:PxKF domain-containing protein [Anaerolineales bacterium]